MTGTTPWTARSRSARPSSGTKGMADASYTTRFQTPQNAKAPVAVARGAGSTRANSARRTEVIPTYRRTTTVQKPPFRDHNGLQRPVCSGPERSSGVQWPLYAGDKQGKCQFTYLLRRGVAAAHRHWRPTARGLPSLRVVRVMMKARFCLGQSDAQRARAPGQNYQIMYNKFIVYQWPLYC